MIWLQFIISSALIVFGGIRLTTYADALSDRLQLGKVWIGVVLLGFVTSLPEASASLTAIISLDAPDLAVGNMVGSNSFNILLIFVMDLFFRQGAVTNAINFKRSHIMPAVFAVILTAVVCVELLLPPNIKVPAVGPIGLGSLLIIFLYFYGMRKLAGSESNEEKEQALTQVALPKIYLNLLFSAVLVVLGAMWLANAADVIAEVTGLGRTFVGTIFLAFVTSLPEMVVTVSALRLGALSLAMGNIFGSNMTNMFILALCDSFYTKGSILAFASKTHIITAVLSIILTGIAFAGIKQNNKKTILGIGWDSWVLCMFFFAGMSVLYYLK